MSQKEAPCMNLPECDKHVIPNKVVYFKFEVLRLKVYLSGEKFSYEILLQPESWFYPNGFRSRGENQRGTYPVDTDLEILRVWIKSDFTLGVLAAKILLSDSYGSADDQCLLLVDP